MLFLTRRAMIAGASASLAASLAGCASTNTTPTSFVAAAPAAPPPPPRPAPAAVADAGGFNYKEIYAEMKDANFTVPAVKISQIGPAFLRKNVAYATNEAPGTIVIDPGNHFLYHVEGGGRATRYGVGVGREGFVWVGEATIKSKQEWPDWYPPKEMIERRPDLKREVVDLQSGVGMHGGPSNPLGARAMYLWQGDQDTLFRIHGTNEPSSIGLSQSSGCIRMINQDAIDLYQKNVGRNARGGASVPRRRAGQARARGRRWKTLPGPIGRVAELAAEPPRLRAPLRSHDLAADLAGHVAAHAIAFVDFDEHVTAFALDGRDLRRESRSRAGLDGPRGDGRHHFSAMAQQRFRGDEAHIGGEQAK